MENNCRDVSLSSFRCRGGRILRWNCLPAGMIPFFPAEIRGSPAFFPAVREKKMKKSPKTIVF